MCNYMIHYTHLHTIAWHVWAHDQVLPSTPCQSSSMSSFQVETAGLPPPTSGTGCPWFRASRCSAWNLRRPAKWFSISALGITCASTGMNGNVRRCTIIKDYVRRSSIRSMQPQEHQEHRLVRHHLVFQQDWNLKWRAYIFGSDDGQYNKSRPCFQLATTNNKNHERHEVVVCLLFLPMRNAF